MNSHILETSAETPLLFSEEELNILDFDLIPKHVAIMMDGNRRWARKRSLPPNAGHWRGAETLTHIVTGASQLGIKTLTVFGLSTENWKRPQNEIDALMQLIKIYLIKQRESMVQEGVRLDTIGDLSPFPQDIIEEIDRSKDLTAGGSKIDLILALNYGGRDDIKRATQAIVADCLQGNLSHNLISEETITKYLDTSKWKDPDLIIRTSGENRLSNFLLWQASYAEVLITDVLWPDFNAKDLLQSLEEYQKRERRSGL